jgi:hypothetical protein
MAVANGYGKTVTSGSVFMYDTGDIINSYRGEPTTNLINPNVVNIYSWWTRNVASIVQLSETYKGQPIYRVSISIDNGDMLYHITERWGAGSGWYMPYAIFNANTSYIASVIYRPVSHPDTRIYGHPSNIGGWGATVDGNIDIDTQWKMHRIDRNFGATVGDNRFYHMHTPSAQIGQTIVVDITNSQIEQNNHVTQFVNGTRSATQGLLPLLGNTSLDISTVSFDSNAQIIWDGTDDTISINSYPAIELVDNVSIEYVYMRLSTDPVLDVIANKYHNTGWELFCQTGATFALAGRNGDGTYYATSNPAYTIQNNQYYHLVAIKDGFSWRLYVNGQLYSYLTAGTIGTWSNTGILQIGGEGSGYYPHMKLPIFKIYNTVLSADQVKQNYQQYKSRFNLS